MEVFGAVIHIQKDRLDAAKKCDLIPRRMVKISEPRKPNRDTVPEQIGKVLHSFRILIGAERKNGIAELLQHRFVLHDILVFAGDDVGLIVDASHI